MPRTPEGDRGQTKNPLAKDAKAAADNRSRQMQIKQPSPSKSRSSAAPKARGQSRGR
jgi:hypothetical protein